jgi:hypothetical protein
LRKEEGAPVIRRVRIDTGMSRFAATGGAGGGRVAGGGDMMFVTAFLTTLLTGTVLWTGSPCQRVLTDAGQRVWVQGLPAGTGKGDHVTLEGEWRHLLTCQARVFVVSGGIEGRATAPKQEPLP